MILHWTNKGGFVADKAIKVGDKLCGLQYHNLRPDSVSTNRYELQYMLSNPSWMNMLINALKVPDELSHS